MTLLLTALPARATEALNVCVTTPDARSIAEAIGGDAIALVGLVSAEQDAHVVQPTRRMIEALADAELVVAVGNGLEHAWLPRAIAQAKNPRIAPGQPGYLDLSVNVRALAEQPPPTDSGTDDHGHGHSHGHRHGHNHGHGHGHGHGANDDDSLHAGGNPHYLIDPIEGVKSAAALADRLSELAPASATRFREAYLVFARDIMRVMVGAELADAIDPDEFEMLAIAIENDALSVFLSERGVADLRLDGVLARFEPYSGAAVIGDHDYWTYAARRYRLDVLGYMEPEPGIPPTPKHLQRLIAEMNERDARAILTIKRFDPRHARLVSRATDAVVAPMADVPGSRPDTATYADFVRYNARVLLGALERDAR